ncbi:MAG: EamA family transporter RarD [Candidatus Nanopelagicales bacterium]
MAAGLGAYTLWGLFPLYWGLLEPATALEVLAARVVFALLAQVVLVSALGQWSLVGEVWGDPRARILLALGAVVVSVNWGTYIYAVTRGQVVEASLGYFINPLVSIALGVLVLGERLRRMQWAAVAVAGLAVAWSAWEVGRIPWIALTLAFSFGLYGLAKKLAWVDAVASLTYELSVMLPIALAYLVWLGMAQQSTLFTGWRHFALMAGAGPVTALPLLLFGFAAHRVPLTTLGLLQYLGPTIQLVLGLWVFGEHMSLGRWLGFAGVWVALAIFTFDSWRAQSAPDPA